MLRVQPAVKEVVEIPGEVDVEIEGLKVTVKGPLGVLTRDFSHILYDISVRREEGKVYVEAYGKLRRPVKALIKTLAAHIRNMIVGVTKGFTYRLKIVYSHFPVSIRVKDGLIYIENFIGERSPRVAKIVGDVKVEVEKDDILVKGIDIEAVGQTAANIEQATKVKRKDPRVFLDGIYIYAKEEGM